MLNPYRVGQLVTITKENDSFRNIVGKIVEIGEDELTVDLRYIRRTYKFTEVLPIIEGKPV